MQNINIKDLSFAYPDEPETLILKDINLDIKPGEFVCLLGQSGCGKSTLLRLIAGLEKATTGTISIDGQVSTGTSLDRSVVFQDYGLFPWLTAGDNLVMALKRKYPKRSKKELKEISLDMLKKVGLSEAVYNKYPKELSGGMKQRCAIAQSFSIDPPVLLMDEPFGALDAVTRAKLQNLILNLWSKEEKRKTVVFVTHDVDEALLLGSRICVLGQKPSQIIFDCTIENKDSITRDSLYKDEEIQRRRNELIMYINRDVSEHIDE